MATHTTRAENRPAFVNIPHDALAAVVRAGRLLQHAGDVHGAVALYEHFINMLQAHEIVSIQYAENCVYVPDTEHPGTERLEYSPMRAHYA